METEAFPYRFTRGIQAYWRRRKYQKVDGSAPGKRSRVARLGRAGGAARRFFRIRPNLRIRLRIPSPARLLARLRDAYIDAMLSLAGKAPAMSAPGGSDSLWTKRIPRARQAQARTKPSEFERRLIAEIYKSLAAAGELTAV